jgi:hypothetical protein
MNLNDSVSGQQKEIVFWAVSPDRALAILSMSADDEFPIVVEMRR